MIIPTPTNMPEVVWTPFVNEAGHDAFEFVTSEPYPFLRLVVHQNDDGTWVAACMFRRMIYDYPDAESAKKGAEGMLRTKLFLIEESDKREAREKAALATAAV